MAAIKIEIFEKYRDFLTYTYFTDAWMNTFNALLGDIT